MVREDSAEAASAVVRAVTGEDKAAGDSTTRAEAAVGTVEDMAEAASTADSVVEDKTRTRPLMRLICWLD